MTWNHCESTINKRPGAWDWSEPEVTVMMMNCFSWRVFVVAVFFFFLKELVSISQPWWPHTGVKVGEGRDSVCSWWGLIDAGREKCHKSLPRSCAEHWNGCWVSEGMLSRVEQNESGLWDELQLSILNLGMCTASPSQPWCLHLLNKEEHSAYLSGLLWGVNETTYYLHFILSYWPGPNTLWKHIIHCCFAP